MSERRPAYYSRFPCRGCGEGYLACAQGWIHNLMCCMDCAHPARFATAEPYTADELADMHARSPR